MDKLYLIVENALTVYNINNRLASTSSLKRAKEIVLEQKEKYNRDALIIVCTVLRD